MATKKKAKIEVKPPEEAQPLIAAIVDTETTGTVEPVIPVEVAILGIASELDGFQIIERFWSRYNPGKKIELGAMATHHIREQDVANCPPFSSFGWPLTIRYMVGHNVDFDWGALGKPDVKRIDTLCIARKLWPQFDNHKLGTCLYGLMGPSAKEKLVGSHGALVDAGTCATILEFVVEATGLTTWEGLYEFSEAARVPDVMPFGKHKGQSFDTIPNSYKSWLLGQPDVDPYLRQALSAR